jgi:hypothetical protein
MPDRKRDQARKGGEPSGSEFVKAVFGFFSSVLKSITTDDLLRVLWGVEVLLFVILAFMIWFGDITADQRFNLALIVIASVVSLFAFSAWRSQGHRSTPPAVPDSPPDVVAQAQKCLKLLIEIHDANARIIRRGQSGSGPWAMALTDTYGRVCETCHRRRLGTEPPDAYFDAICAEPDVDAVCKRKWELGETLDVYRARLSRVSSLPADHDDLELLIRRSVTQPDRSPLELQTAVDQAIERAKRML